MTAPALPDQLRADTVLGTLQAIIEFAEQGSDLRVTQASVTFSHAVLRSVGGSNPAFWIIPADLLSAEGSQTETQKLSFVLKRRAPAFVAKSFGEDLARSLQAVRAGLHALAPLSAEFASTASIEFSFELSVEGKISFFLKAGGKRSDGNTLTLELAPS
ncbi:hypothetical protein [Deinococcus ruber]|uniref:Uncharacterized protein n=1 Tax=Deinococcus ruber TaxID=1848197 RepID=A0A918CEP1_9DEIO|nr:hypothetical protein [Deinococcus ruber]GGR18910.1 hypothetical protein GCM10008957_34460 [Deinococcus ruber]